MKTNVVNKELNRILIYSRSSVDIFFKSTLDEMRITYVRLQHTNNSQKGFKGGRLTSLEVINLPVTIGTRLFEKNMMLYFIVVEEINPY